MAETSLIDTMARGMHEGRLRRRHREAVEWGECHPIYQQSVREDVVALLRSLIDAGPTPAMLDRVCSDYEHATIRAHDDAITNVFREMLRAALEEADNAR